MRIAAAVLIGVVAALHGYFLVLEMFLWRTPFGRRTFGTTKEAAES
jgi:putative membrane protein